MSSGVQTFATGAWQQATGKTDASWGDIAKASAGSAVAGATSSLVFGGLTSKVGSIKNPFARLGATTAAGWAAGEAGVFTGTWVTTGSARQAWDAATDPTVMWNNPKMSFVMASFLEGKKYFKFESMCAGSKVDASVPRPSAETPVPASAKPTTAKPASPNAAPGIPPGKPGASSTTGTRAGQVGSVAVASTTTGQASGAPMGQSSGAGASGPQGPSGVSAAPARQSAPQGHVDFVVSSKGEVFPVPTNAVARPSDNQLGTVWEVPAGMPGGGNGLAPKSHRDEAHGCEPILEVCRPVPKRVCCLRRRPGAKRHAGKPRCTACASVYWADRFAIRSVVAYQSMSVMVVEDLLWRHDSAPLGLARAFEGALEGADWLLEAEACDIRFVGVANVVGILFDLRTGLFDPRPWGIEANAAVLVVRGVTACRLPSIRDQISSWEASRDELVWSCRFTQWHTPDAVEIVGMSASLYVGQVPGLPPAQPWLGDAAPAELRSGWPDWGREFQITAEPEHANAHLIKGYLRNSE